VQAQGLTSNVACTACAHRHSQQPLRCLLDWVYKLALCQGPLHCLCCGMLNTEQACSRSGAPCPTAPCYVDKTAPCNGPPAPNSPLCCSHQSLVMFCQLPTASLHPAARHPSYGLCAAAISHWGPLGVALCHWMLRCATHWMLRCATGCCVVPLDVALCHWGPSDVALCHIRSCPLYGCVPLTASSLLAARCHAFYKQLRHAPSK